MICTQCKSERIIKGLRPVDRGHLDCSSNTLGVEIIKNPEARIFKGYTNIPLFAHICKDCGNVMFQLSAEELEEVNRLDEGRD